MSRPQVPRPATKASSQAGAATQAGDGRPLTNSVLARWEGGWRCRVKACGFDLAVDEPSSAGGTGTGPMPTEYLLAAMASCYALALVWVAGKRGISLPGLTVTATGTYDGPRFSRLRLTAAADAPADVVERLLEPALRVCYVSNTIAASPPIEVAAGSSSQTPG
jgi:putative redox protein